MHRLRKELLIRLLLVLLVLGGAGYYAFESTAEVASRVARLRARVFQVGNVDLPAEAEKGRIAMGISLVEEKGRGGQHSYLLPSLVEKKEGKVETARLTLIARGKREQYAMINDRVYRVGDTLPDGRRIQALNHDGALLSAMGRSEMLPWLPPLKVELKRAAPEPVDETVPAEEETEVQSPVEKRVERVVMNADKAMQLLKQLETLGGTK